MHSFGSALTLYRSGTLSLPQAARLAGCAEAALASAPGPRTRSRQPRTRDAGVGGPTPLADAD
jgi:hypothetical protein